MNKKYEERLIASRMEYQKKRYPHMIKQLKIEEAELLKRLEKIREDILKYQKALEEIQQGSEEK